MRIRMRGLLAIALLLTLTACSSPKQGVKDAMTVKQSAFSEETKQVLRLLDDQMAFFDFAVDDTIKSYTVQAWVYEQGAWVDRGGVSADIDGNRRIAIQVNDGAYALFTMEEDGYTKYVTEMNMGFEHTTGQASVRITNPEDIVVGKEIPLWVKIANDKNGILIPSAFRQSDCTAGFAFTVTFWDKEVQE